MKMKLPLTLSPIAPVALLLGLLVSFPFPLPLRAQNYQAPANPQPVPLEETAPVPSDDAHGATTRAIEGVKDGVGAVVDTLKDNHWQQSVEVKAGNVYLLRRSTDEPVKPGEIVILRFRTPTEMKNKSYLFARNPRAQVELSK